MQQKITIIRNFLVIKKNASCLSSIKISFLYNSFSYHIKSIPFLNNIFYIYKKGDTLSDKLRNNTSYEQLRMIIIDLARKISINHRKHTIISNNYDRICKERRINTNVRFVSRSYYYSKIHGDINTENIIVRSNNTILFIDRMCYKGDLLFDFTFILSILCYYYQTDNFNYLVLIRDFFDIYERIFIDKNEFYCSFRDNFLNYCFYAYNDSGNLHRFPEWQYCLHIVKELSSFTNFNDFLYYKIRSNPGYYNYITQWQHRE